MGTLFLEALPIHLSLTNIPVLCVQQNNFLLLKHSTHSVSYFHEYLPTEVLVHIFSYLKERELSRIGQVCRRFHEISNLESLWKNLFYRVYEMDEAYVLPNNTDLSLSPSKHTLTPKSTSQLPWKEQCRIMVSTLSIHLYKGYMSIIPVGMKGEDECQYQLSLQ